MMSALFKKLFTGLHAKIYQLTGGKAGGVDKMLVLHTTGAKSGKARESPLLYLIDNDRYVIVASNGGAANHPGWYHNLKAAPSAKVTIGREVIDVTAEVLSTEEKDRIWPELVSMYAAYDKYRDKTDRDIQLVALTAN